MRLNKHRWMSWTVASVVGISGIALCTHRAAADSHDHMINPQIHHALDALYAAHDEIDHTHHSFHGKKREALDVLDHAIDRLEEIKDYHD